MYLGIPVLLSVDTQNNIAALIHFNTQSKSFYMILHLDEE